MYRKQMNHALGQRYFHHEMRLRKCHHKRRRGRFLEHKEARRARDIKGMVALLAQNEYKGASCQHMSELLVRQKGIHISSKSVSRILKERGIANPYSHKACTPRRSSTRAQKFIAVKNRERICPHPLSRRRIYPFKRCSYGNGEFPTNASTMGISHTDMGPILGSLVTKIRRTNQTQFYGSIKSCTSMHRKTK